MISVIISCGNCGHAVVLSPKDDNQSNVTTMLRKENKFDVTVSFEDFSEPNVDDEFITKLKDSKENIKEFIEENIIDQINIFSEILDITFTCKECGDSIELTEFDKPFDT